MMTQTTTETNSVKYHLNIPQLLYSTIKPHIGICIWGRFTGKTDGPAADFCLNNVLSMPGSNGFIQGKTYAHLMGMTVDGLVAAWEKRGYIRDIHFWIGKFPPANLKIPNGIRRPIKPDHYITWYNGSGIYLVSQDKSSSINGVRTQWGLVDEAKLIDKKKFDEQTIPTMAGGFKLWGHLSCYNSLLFCSDMPQHSSQKWLLDFEPLVNKKQIEVILQTQLHISILHKQFVNLGDEITAQKEAVAKQITKYKRLLNELRKESVYFSEASALDNVDAVGLAPIKNAKRVLSDLKFRVQILNERIIKNENGFYGLLDPREHSDTLIDYEYLESLDEDDIRRKHQDCRWDADIVKNKPLHISFDHNNAINCVITSQKNDNTLRFLSSKYTLHPEMINSCVKLWHDYYQYHPVKELHYWHDATSTGEGASDKNISYADEIREQLISLGWKVITHHIGQIGTHHSRYLLWGKLFQGTDKRLPKFMYNGKNCEQWETSALGAGYYKAGNKYQKDKTTERKDSGVPPQDATHLSEAGDIIVWGSLIEYFKDRRDMVTWIGE